MYTGERILPGGKFNVTFQQSLFAYAFVRRVSAGLRVLDVGSGEGYGCAYLAATAAEVVGIDKDGDAVRAASERYAQLNVSYVTADLFRAREALAGRQFDLVCCFQTIEHVDDQDEFLDALVSLTVPGGRVVVTTPNRDMFPTYNPYHVRELDVTSIRALFSRHFPHVELSGVFGDHRVLSYRQSKQKIGNLFLRLDPFGVRDRLPRPLTQALYDRVSFLIKSVSYLRKRREVEEISLENFSLRRDELESALDFLAVGVTASA